MNVLHILGSLKIGGAENLVLDLIRTNNSIGENSTFVFHLVYMHYSASDSKRKEEFSNTNINLKFISCAKGIGNTLSFIIKLRKYIIDNNIQVVHCHNNIDAYWAYLAVSSIVGSNNRIKIILSVHGLNLNFNYLAQKFKLLGASLEKNILNNIALTYVSATTKDYYIKKYPNLPCFAKGRVIYNGIEPNKFTTASAYNKERLSIENDAIVMGMIGNFNTSVRLQLLLCYALSIVNERISNVNAMKLRFLFIGRQDNIEPQLYSSCVDFCERENLHKSNARLSVMFLGQRDDIPQLLKTMDAYVYASSADTFGISVLEAIVSGRRVLCSNIPTFREITLGGQLATLVENSAIDFAEAIYSEYLYFANKEACCVVNSDLARAEKAISLYSISNSLKQYSSLYIKRDS